MCPPFFRENRMMDMNRIIVFFLVFATLLTGCAASAQEAEIASVETTVMETVVPETTAEPATVPTEPFSLYI